MKSIHTRVLTALLCFFVGTASQAQPARLSTEHDGRWTVSLVCEDVKDKTGWVKGYRFDFPVDVIQGKLAGQHGVVGQPSSVAFDGDVQEDGQLRITATGMTGESSYAVGKVARGTPYSYTLRGALGPSSGQAQRKELRPCTASFARQ
jgi:hypothetical protein